MGMRSGSVRNRALGILYLVIFVASLILTVLKFASLGWSLLSAAQPAPLYSSHYEVSGHTEVQNRQAPDNTHRDGAAP